MEFRQLSSTALAPSSAKYIKTTAAESVHENVAKTGLSKQSKLDFFQKAFSNADTGYCHSVL